MRITVVSIHIIICTFVLSGLLSAQETGTKFDTWMDIATIYGFSANLRGVKYRKKVITPIGVLRSKKLKRKCLSR